MAAEGGEIEPTASYQPGSGAESQQHAELTLSLPPVSCARGHVAVSYSTSGAGLSTLAPGKSVSAQIGIPSFDCYGMLVFHVTIIVDNRENSRASAFELQFPSPGIGSYTALLEESWNSIFGYPKAPAGQISYYTPWASYLSANLTPRPAPTLPIPAASPTITLTNRDPVNTIKARFAAQAYVLPLLYPNPLNSADTEWK